MNQDQLLGFLIAELNIQEYQASLDPVSGGDINQSFVLRENDSEICFVKFNAMPEVLECEYLNLIRLNELGAPCFPKPFGFWKLETGAVLAMKYVPMRRVTSNDAEALAHRLCQLHEITSKKFGWLADGMIGFSRQRNQRCDQWSTFFQKHRIGPQLKWAIDNGLSADYVSMAHDRSTKAAELLSGLEVVPRLVHGDLWAGNVGVDLTTGEPILFDPAPYYGHAKTDLAMAKLFGGFSNDFFLSYARTTRNSSEDNCSDVDEGLLRNYYNLYHALNHFNMFGHGYEPLVESVLSKI